MPRRHVVIARGAAFAVVCAAAVVAQESGPRVRSQTVMMPMRDGARLATDVHLPVGDGPWPALLMRTPYNRVHLRMFDHVERGYAVVVQDVRGRFDSEGANVPFVADGWGLLQDGYDTVEWVAEQSWCDGKVGTFGPSALGIVQNLTACATPPHLVCEYVIVAPASLYHYCAYQGGALRFEQVDGWLKRNAFAPEAFDLFFSHPTYDETWAALDCTTRHHLVTVPTVQRGGWFDTFSQGQIESFVGLQHNGGPGAAGNQKLIMGPWGHGAGGTPEQGELTFPENFRGPGVGESSRRWFDHWLRGMDTGVMSLPAVAYYTIGDVDDPEAPGNVWRHADDWPVPASPTPLYLQTDSSLRRGRPFRPSASRCYSYDPLDPVPTVGGNNLLIASGPADQRPVESCPDVLVFTTPPLERPVEVTGRVWLTLWASSSCPDTDFTAKLCDVYPDGRSMLVCDGVLRTRYRNSFSAPELLRPGRAYKFEVDLWSTSIVFAAGHRIRLSVSSSNHPRFDVNPNTGVPFEEGGETHIACNRVYMDLRRPSHVLLPVVK